jgi:hypothetical protein
MEEALWLAQRHGEHDLYLALQLQLDEAARGGGGGAAPPAPVAGAPAAPPASGAATAAAYLRALPFLDAHYYALRFGRALLCGAPAEAAELFSRLCVKWPVAAAAASAGGGGARSSSGAPAPPSRAAPDSFLPFFVDKPLLLKGFCEAVVLASGVAGSGVAPPTSALWHALLEVSLRRDVYPVGEGGDWEKERDECVMSGVLKNATARYDAPTALVLCNAAGYRAGTVYLYDRLGMGAMALAALFDLADAQRRAGQHHLARATRRDIVRRAKAAQGASVGGGSGGENGGGAAAAGAPATAPPAAPAGEGADAAASAADVEAASLWMSVLQFLAAAYVDERGCTVAGAGAGEGGAPPLPVAYPGLSLGTPGYSPGALQREREEQDSLLADALRFVDASGVLSPLAAMPALARCPHLPFGLVRDFLLKRLLRDEARAAEDAARTAALAGEIAAFEAESARLDSGVRVFQARSCRVCGMELDLPSVHFMCGGLRGGGGGGGGGAGGGGAGGEGAPPGASRGEEHSFHLLCVTQANQDANMGGGEGAGGGAPTLECPLCAEDHNRVKGIAAKLGPRPGLSEQYFRELRATPSGRLFDKAAEYLSKGLFAEPSR